MPPAARPHGDVLGGRNRARRTPSNPQVVAAVPTSGARTRADPRHGRRSEGPDLLTVEGVTDTATADSMPDPSQPWISPSSSSAPN